MAIAILAIAGAVLNGGEASSVLRILLCRLEVLTAAVELEEKQ